MGGWSGQKIWAVVIAAVAAVLLLAPAGVGAATTPTLSLTPNCDSYVGEDGPHYGVRISVSGLPANGVFTGSLVLTVLDPAGSYSETVIPPTQVQADASGSFSIISVGSQSDYPVLWTATISFEGGTLAESLTVDCEPDPVPATKSDCKKGGWRAFGFKNQGRCIASLEHGSGHRR